MSNRTLTLGLTGHVPLDLFAITMQRFQELIELLTQTVSGDANITWIIDEPIAASTAITIRGESPTPGAVERVSRAYVIVGQSLERGQPVPYSPGVAQAAQRIAEVLNGMITSIQFAAGDDLSTVTSSSPVEPSSALLGAYGSVEGRIETVTHRSWLGFILYDHLHDRPVRCHLRAEQSDIIRNAWDRRVIVQGWINRDPLSGRAVYIDPVMSIEVLPEVEKGSYRRARAIAPAGPDEPSTEVVIRRLRDAG